MFRDHTCGVRVSRIFMGTLGTYKHAVIGFDYGGYDYELDVMK